MRRILRAGSIALVVGRRSRAAALARCLGQLGAGGVQGLTGAIRLPGGTTRSLSGSAFPIPVMGKTGTTSEFRDALFVGSTYGPRGITVAVRIGFDDNRTLGSDETGGRAALPVFREIMLRVYEAALVGTVPKFPRDMEGRIDAYLARPSPLPVVPDTAATVADLAPPGGEPSRQVSLASEPSGPAGLTASLEARGRGGE